MAVILLDFNFGAVCRVSGFAAGIPKLSGSSLRRMLGYTGRGRGRHHLPASPACPGSEIISQYPWEMFSMAHPFQETKMGRGEGVFKSLV